MKHFYLRSFLIISMLLAYNSSRAQLCDATVPVFNIDFTGKPDSIYTVTNVIRDGLCCTETSPNRCIEFIIIMDPQQQGIALNSSGGPALGAGGIHVECDTTTYSFLDTICLSGVGPHHITLCKPGGNAYDYSIIAIPGPKAGPPIAVSNGCTGIIYASGYSQPSIVWTSVFPGPAGTYDTYLSCTNGCDTSIVTAQPGYPDSVLYQVSGSPVGACSAISIKDSVWVYFVSDKAAAITPANPFVCAGLSNAVLTANGTGGLPPYSYLWSTGDSTQTITVGVGTYWVRISDKTTCPPVFDTVTVVSVPKPIADFTSSPACTNSAAAFTDLSTISSGSISSWNWDFGDGSSSTLQNPAHTYTAALSYNVTLIAFSLNGCSDTITKTIIVNPSPAAAFTINNACFVDSVGFTDNSTVSSGTIVSWVWNFGDGNTSTQQNPFHVYTSSGIYTITLTVTSNLGCSNTASATALISYTNAGFTDDAPACQGVPINFTDTSSVDGSTTITNWSWSFGDGTFSTSQNPSHAYSTGGVFNVTLVITSGNGCKDSVTQAVNIQGMPMAIAGNDTTSCANNAALNLSGTIINAGGGIWIGTGGFSPSNTANNILYNPTAAAIAAGTDTLLLITTSNALCPADTDQIVITFSPGPTDSTGADIFVCKDTVSVPICAAVTVSSGGFWQTMGSGTFVDDSALCTLYIPSTSDTTAGSVIVYNTTTGNGNCLAVSDSVKIIFTSTPTVTITMNDTACAGNPIALSVNTSTGSGTWGSMGTGTFLPNNTALNGVYMPSPADDLAGNVTLFFTSTNNGGCFSAHDTLLITLIPSPTASYSSVSACQAFPVFFTDLSTSTGFLVGWNWNFGDGSPAVTLQNPSHVFNMGGPYNVQLIVTSNNGCVDTLTKAVTVYYKPAAGFDANGICLKDGTQFTDTSTVIGSTITSWNWNFGDGGSSILQNPSHYYASSGNYTSSLIVQSAQGCIDTVSQTIGVLPAPTADFSIDDATANIGQTVHFTDQSTNGAAAWFWDFGDSRSDSTSTLQNPSHAYSETGYFNVCLYVSDVNGCTDTICKQEIVSLPPTVPSGFTPNGDGENDILYIYGGPFKTLDFKIYNNWGELIFESDKQSKGWNGKRKDIDQPVGVYVYTIIAESVDGEKYKLSGDVTLLR